MSLAGLELLAGVTEALRRSKIDFAVIGAAALAAHGIIRSTFDLDLLTVDAAVLDAGRFQALTSNGVAVDVRRGDFDDPLRGVVRFHGSGQRTIDIVVGKWKWLKAVLESATPMVYGSMKLPTVTMSDLVLLKLDSEGPQDLIDVQNLLRLGGEKLRSEVEVKLEGLPETVAKAWKRVVVM